MDSNNYHLELVQKIKSLQLEKQFYEDDIKVQFCEILEKIDPVAMVKEQIVKLSTDNEIKINAVKLALNFGTNFLIKKLSYKDNFIKKYLFSTITSRFPKSFVSKII